MHLPRRRARRAIGDGRSWWIPDERQDQRPKEAFCWLGSHPPSLNHLLVWIDHLRSKGEIGPHMADGKLEMIKQIAALPYRVNQLRRRRDHARHLKTAPRQRFLA
jgi:hypothetical protein